jgi:hypothetical protein
MSCRMQKRTISCRLATTYGSGNIYIMSVPFKVRPEGLEPPHLASEASALSA